MEATGHPSLPYSGQFLPKGGTRKCKKFKCNRYGLDIQISNCMVQIQLIKTNLSVVQKVEYWFQKAAGQHGHRSPGGQGGGVAVGHVLLSLRPDGHRQIVVPPLDVNIYNCYFMQLLFYRIVEEKWVR